MGYKGVVKDSVIVLEEGMKLPEGTEAEVTAQGWWMSEEAKRFVLWLSRRTEKCH